ncbi:MAG: murein biosynthesis integral membrane protein MurJ [Armatimonadota bacterium]|nr:murein biosynthesis integral membrane protein MurJ [Armatimonadota bacterium]MDR7437103.1 murein biosynthesis integral membrane protein MurJ [Armatimonadota bacterium]MDR7472448.1 murein biosynthesis integral membrane protein MurJ [Armatimonadota bacterium]MDR7506647.1 murein biosynthesis integral membrane protein MurJ [Armatimonadota bacterium]MDR7509205.1 murein biosynthesis integral membrane protein MurJ [Armatimonadota bacterium]
MSPSSPSAPVRLVRAASLMAGATVVSRALGLVREVVTAWLFGASDAKAAYVVAYSVPFFIQRLLLGGTLSIVFIPTLSRLLAQDEAEARRVAGITLTVVAAGGVALAVAGQALAPVLVALAAPGFARAPALLDLAVDLTRIIFVAMLFLALAIYLTGFLQAHQRFAPPALAPLVFNGVIIVGTLTLGPRVGIRGLALSWVLGTAAQMLVQWWPARRLGLRPVGMDLRHPAIREMARLAVPAMLGLAVVEVNAYVDRFFASLLPAAPTVHPVAALDYAYEIVQAPAGIFAISVATAAFPALARHAAAGDRADLRATFSLALRSLMVVILPVAALAVALREPLVRIIFQRGEFGPHATQAVAGALAGYAVGLPAIAGYYVVTRTLYALQDMATPVRTGVAMIALNAVLDVVFMRWWGVVGIAAATSVVAVVNLALMLAALRGHLGRLDGRRILATAGRAALAAALGGGVMVPVAGAAGSSGPVSAGAAALAAACGLAAYVGVCRVLRVAELGLVVALLRGRPAPGGGGDRLR